MPVFAYEGRTSGGEVRKGEVEAADTDSARSRLRQMQIQATSVKPKAAGGMSAAIKLPQFDFMKPKVGTKDLVIFVRQFATMIDSGLPLVQCLDIQSKQASNPTFREQLTDIKGQV
jgi:type IV pilus assembly protein PilC